MSSAGSTIPYERQEDVQTNRMCGAAALSMVYRSFGKSIPQAEIWSRISKHNRFGSLASTTHLMAQDALSRGYAALAIQAKQPLQVLRICRENGIRALLNHRLGEDSPTGHYSVLVDIDADGVVLHDPFVGPSRRLSHEELLRVWQKGLPHAEISGNMLIGIAARPVVVPPCPVCKTPMPAEVGCPDCRKPLVLQPAALLGCVGPECVNRLWNYVCCPACDYTWSFSAQRVADSGSAADPLNLDRLSDALERFCSYVLSLPGAADRPDLLNQVEVIRASKEKLRLARSEDLANRDAHQTQAKQAQQKYEQDEKDLLKNKEEIEKPSPPADGNALGKSLLKDLGLLT